MKEENTGKHNRISKQKSCLALIACVRSSSFLFLVFCISRAHQVYQITSPRATAKPALYERKKKYKYCLFEH